MPGHLLGASSTFGAVGTIAAWEQGEPWLRAVRAEIVARRAQLAARLAADLPMVGFDPPEATYLGWLDLRATGLGDAPAKRLVDDVGLALSEGSQFGEQGGGWARINFATSPEILDAAVDRLAEAIAGLA
jgi:cystathionine beta-lyase